MKTKTQIATIIVMEGTAEIGAKSPEMKIIASKLIDQCCGITLRQISTLPREFDTRYPLGPENPNSKKLIETAYSSLPEMVRLFVTDPNKLLVRERSVEKMEGIKVFIGGKNYGERITQTQTSIFLEKPMREGCWVPLAGNSHYQLVLIMREPIDKPVNDTEIVLQDLIAGEITACQNRVEKVRAKGAPPEKVSEEQEKQGRAIARLKKIPIEDILVMFNNYYYKDRGINEPIINVLRIAGIRFRRSLDRVVIEAVEFLSDREKIFVKVGEFSCNESKNGDGDKIWRAISSLANDADKKSKNENPERRRD